MISQTTSLEVEKAEQT